MSFFWESSIDSGTIGGAAGAITVENYFLYTRDIQLSRGGTVGINAQPTRVLSVGHPDYYRLGRDNKSDWQQVAVFSKPGFTTILVVIWVQAFQGALDDELNLLQLKGKRLLIPLNSGPGYLATRNADEFLMATPTAGVSSNGAIGLNWIAVRADMHNLHGFVTNDLVEPSVNPKQPWSVATHAYTGDKIFTETGSFFNLKFIDSTLFTDQDKQHPLEFPRTKGHLQTGDAPDSPYDQALQGKSGIIYTGGNLVIHARTEQASGGPVPQFAQLGVNIQTNSVMSLRDATLIDTVDDGSSVWHFFRLEDVLDVAVDTDLSTFSGTTMLPKMDIQLDFPDSFLSQQSFGVYVDPWLSLALPPPYTITSTDGQAVFGGYLP